MQFSILLLFGLIRMICSLGSSDPCAKFGCGLPGPHPCCASDGKTYLYCTCDFEYAKCRNPGLTIVHHGRCEPKDSHHSRHRPRMGYPGMDYPGMGYPGMGYPGMGYPERGYPGMGYPERGYPGMGYPGA